MEVLGALVVILAIFLLVVLFSAIKILREYERGVIFRLGRLINTKGPGLILLIPFIDRMVKIDLRTVTLNIPPQEVITRDNVPTSVNAVCYFRVIDPNRAITDVENYLIATSQISQTSLRAVLGKAELDEILAERERLNESLQKIIDEQTEPWGVKVLRYEIKTIAPPHDILAAMEKQMRAEREKRATILNSEASREAAINNAEGDKQKVIKESEANRQLQINQAEGEASAILAVATATAEGLRKVAAAIHDKGGFEAVQLRVAEAYIAEFGKLAKAGNTLIVPTNLADVASFMGTAMNVIKKTEGGGGTVVR